MDLEDLKQWFDGISAVIIFISFCYLFFFVAFAPPSDVFPAVRFFVKRFTALQFLSHEILLPNVVWISGFFISGSILSRMLILLTKFFPELDFRSEGEKYLERHNIKSFDE